MKVYKISTTLTEKESKLGVEKIEPVWGDLLSAKDYYFHSAARTRTGLQILKPGELGCTLSHINILEKIAKSGTPALITESDIPVDQIKLNRTEEYIKRFPQTDFLHCAQYGNKDFRCWNLRDGRRLVDTSYKFWGTCAYYCSKRTAIALIDFHEKYGLGLADDWHRFFTKHSILPFYYPVFRHPDGQNTIKRNSIPRSYAASLSQLMQDRAQIRLSFALRKISRTLKYGFSK